MVEERDQMLDALAQVDVFKELPREELARLAAGARTCAFPAGSELMRQGEAGDSMHVVVKGRVRVERLHPKLTAPLVLAELEPYEIVGEVAVMDGEPRSATVTALEDTETVELDGRAVAETISRFSRVSIMFLRLLSQRLRRADELAEQLLGKEGGA